VCVRALRCAAASVDHLNSRGQLNLRERTDNKPCNASLHPQHAVKDYRLHTFFDLDSSLPAPAHACTGSLDPSLTQPAWGVPPNATNVAPVGAALTRWRVLHAAQRVCVDFFVRRRGGGGAAGLERLPSAIQYFGNCTSAARVLRGEVLAQANVYADFDYSDQDASLYTPPPGATACGTAPAPRARDPDRPRYSLRGAL